MTWTLDEELVPTIPIGQWFTNLIDWITEHLEWLLGFIDDVLYGANDGLTTALTWVPAVILAVVLGLIGWAIRSWIFGVGALIGMLLIMTMRIWTAAMETLSLVIVSGLLAMIIALPLGMLSARNATVSKVVRPVMDLMQTMPAFVFLIPALFFFSIGTVPGIVSTVVFAMPPGVRLTELGIRQVDAEMVEAGHSFGSKPGAILRRVQIPLAMPTIMAGVNQVIMLALSMVVIAGMVGAGGLGEIVYEGVTRVQLDTGFEGGLAVVIVAIYLDRLTASLGDRSAVARAARATAKAGR